MENIFKNKKLIRIKLKEFGFKKNGNKFLYQENIMNGEFMVKIEISEPNNVKTQTLETETGDLYTLHLTDSDGTFVGKVREEYNNLLHKIALNCFENTVFKFKDTYKVIDYVKKKYGDDVEYLWEKFPENAIARRKDNSKWYLALLTVGKNRLGFDSEELVEVIDLRVDKDVLPELIKQDNIFPGYHMNKKHWISILLDGSVDIKKIYEFIDQSYILAKNK